MRKIYEPKKAKIIIKQKTHFGDVVSVEQHNIMINKNNEATRGVTEKKIIDHRQSTDYRVKTGVRKNSYIFSREERVTINRK